LIASRSLVPLRTFERETINQLYLMHRGVAPMNALRRLGPGCVVGLLVALGCSKPVPQDTPVPADGGATQPSALAKVDATAPNPAPATKVDPGGETFHELSFVDALHKAKSDNRLLMVSFYAVGLGPCKELDETTWKDAKVQAWLRANTVAVKLDRDKSKDAVEKYKIGISLPVMLFVRADGFEVGRLVGYHNPDQFLHDAAALIAPK
jgi:hypothetical protein